MCICDMGKVLSKTNLKNEHFLKKELTLSLVKDNESFGIAIFENNTTIAVFAIKYCPVCGNELIIEKPKYDIEKLNELDRLQMKLLEKKLEDKTATTQDAKALCELLNKARGLAE